MSKPATATCSSSRPRGHVARTATAYAAKATPAKAKRANSTTIGGAAPTPMMPAMNALLHITTKAAGAAVSISRFRTTPPK